MQPVRCFCIGIVLSLFFMQSAFATVDTDGGTDDEWAWASHPTATHITASASGNLERIGVDFAGGFANGHVRVAIYSDDGTRPDDLLASSASVVQSADPGFQDIEVTGVSIVQGTHYWLVWTADDYRHEVWGEPSSGTGRYYEMTYPYLDSQWPASDTPAIEGHAVHMRMTYSEPSEKEWFNTSYNYRYEIKSTATSPSQVISVEFGPHLLWTNKANAANGETRWVYCEVSGCGTGRFAVGNETHEVPWESDDGTGYHPQELWETSAVRIFHMPFQTSSNVLYDSSQNRIDGALNGAEVNKSGVLDGALEFNGGQGDITNVPALSSAYTVSFWAYPYEIECAGGSWHTGVVLYLYNGISMIMDNPGSGCQWYMSMYTNDGWKIISAPIGSSVANGWIHYTGRWDGTTMSLWLNGTLIAQVAATSNRAAATYDHIGRQADYPQSVFNGILDDIRIYNRSLSDTEIRDLYYDGAGTLTSLGPEEIYSEPSENGWFDTSYGYRYEIKSNATSASQVIAVEFGQHMLWTKSANAANGETRWLYCEVSGCGVGKFAVANETDEVPWELDSGTGYQTTQLWADGAAAVYHLSETAGAVAHDSTANGYDGNITSGSWNTNGLLGEALEFNADGYVTLPDASMRNMPTGTVSFWVRRSVTGVQQGLFVRQTDGVNTDLLFKFEADDRLSWKVGDSMGYQTTDATFGTGWVHVVGTWDGTYAVLYANGMPLVTTATSNGIADAAATFTSIGTYWNHAEGITGLMDEVRIYSDAKSAGWVEQEYLNGLGGLAYLGPEEEFFDAISRIKALEAHVAELESRTTYLEDQVAELENRATASESSISALYGMVDGLSNSLNDLTNRTTVLEGAVSALDSAVDGLANLLNDAVDSLNYSINRIKSYLSYLPRATRKNMLCGAMIANNETAATDLRLSCQVNYTPVPPRCTCIDV